MSIDDRIRAATQAAADTVREIRPLAPPPEDSPAHAGRPGSGAPVSGAPVSGAPPGAG